MDHQKPARSHHALLVGIDCYSKEPLEGAVRDVKAINAHLERRHDPAQMHVRMLTATTPQGASAAGTPSEDPELWPTYENVTAALDDIAAKVRPGDCAYMHFSGHGTRMAATRAFANEATGELALNLLTYDGLGIRYLRGEELAASLKRIVVKGVLLTVVLDCCFSGSVLRRDHASTVRELRYDPIIDQRYPTDVVLHASDSGALVRRDASAVPNWMINPDGYTIMTACGPHEVAHEDALDGNEEHGILSYFLLKTLAMWEGTRAPQQAMYRHIVASFKERWPHQNPMLFGNRSLSFFDDHESPADDAHTFVVSTAEAGIRLQVGKAHGVSDGDLFTLFSTRSSPGTDTAAEVLARVEKAGNLTSILALSDSAANSSVQSIRTGWGARQITRERLRQFPIRLAPDLPNLAGVSAALQSRGSLDTRVSGPSTGDYSFHVTMDADDNYIILDGRDQPLSNMPVLSAHMEDGIPRLLGILEHLARFKLVKELANDNTLFQNSFTAQLFTPSGEFTANQEARVTTGDQVVFKVQNTGNRPLYIHIYDMGPRWNIQSIVRGEYHVLPPRKPLEGYSGTLRTKFRMKLPPEMEEAGQQVCEDVLKVFVTTRQTSFLSLELPRLGESVGEMKRPSTSRVSSGDVEEDLTEDWAALGFPIRISAK